MSDYDFTFAHREEGFDNHIEKSIRGYNHLHDDVVNLSRYYVENYTNVVDIGCSTGKTIQAMATQNESHAPRAFYVGVEVAPSFKDDMDKRINILESRFTENVFDFQFQDIRTYEFYNCSLVTSLFTLQFMPPKDRVDVIKNIYKGLNDGGAFIFAEKTVADTGRFQDMFTFTYYDYKRKSFTEKDIMDKEVTLRNMLKPNTWHELTDMLHSAGFRNVQPFWRNFLFVGAIATK
jgi:tRNA (cmo5U34)-methyltransferase